MLFRRLLPRLQFGTQPRRLLFRRLLPRLQFGAQPHRLLFRRLLPRLQFGAQPRLQRLPGADPRLAGTDLLLQAGDLAAQRPLALRGALGKNLRGQRGVQRQQRRQFLRTRLHHVVDLGHGQDQPPQFAPVGSVQRQQNRLADAALAVARAAQADVDDVAVDQDPPCVAAERLAAQEAERRVVLADLALVGIRQQQAVAAHHQAVRLRQTGDDPLAGVQVLHEAGADWRQLVLTVATEVAEGTEQDATAPLRQAIDMPCIRLAREHEASPLATLAVELQHGVFLRGDGVQRLAVDHQVVDIRHHGRLPGGIVGVHVQSMHAVGLQAAQQDLPGMAKSGGVQPVQPDRAAAMEIEQPALVRARHQQAGKQLSHRTTPRTGSSGAPFPSTY